MIVSLGRFDSIVRRLRAFPRLALDTETYGLRPYHGHRLFSIILGTKLNGYYFNFKKYDGMNPALLLDKNVHLPILQKELFDNPDSLWYIHNAANFDLPILAQDNLDLKGLIHCTKAIARVEYNDHVNRDLASCLERIGEAKSEAVEEFIKEHKLYEKVSIPGKAQKVTVKYFDKVPFDIMAPYGVNDGHKTFSLGSYQEKSIDEKDSEQPALVEAGRTMRTVMLNERRLQKTIFRMKHTGVKIDRSYCERAVIFENDRMVKATEKFKQETGKQYIASPKLFGEVFWDVRDLWSYTEKGNPSFESDTLSKFKHPAADAILQIRDSKSKGDFYQGFLYHADRDDVIHPNYNPDGASHGRFSSSDPNFQNLTSEEEESDLEQEFIVRRAIIPRPGFVLVSIDYTTFEYRFMLENACKLLGGESELSKLVRAGHDFHTATAKSAELAGNKVTRKQAKVANFLTLYGGGVARLAEALGISENEAYKIRTAIFKSAPEILNYIKTVQRTAEERGYIINWLGRRCYFPNKSLCYKAPNYHISGGTADIVKVAMNRIDDYLSDKKTKMIMTVHDELIFDTHLSELEFVPAQCKKIMEEVYIGQYVEILTSMEKSTKSLGDLE